MKRSVLLTTGEVVQPDSLPEEMFTRPASSGGMTEENAGLLKTVTGSAERQVIIEVLEKVDYNKTRAAEFLRIDRKTLYNKLRLYSISL